MPGRHSVRHKDTAHRSQHSAAQHSTPPAASWSAAPQMAPPHCRWGTLRPARMLLCGCRHCLSPHTCRFGGVAEWGDGGSVQMERRNAVHTRCACWNAPGLDSWPVYLRRHAHLPSAQWLRAARVARMSPIEGQCRYPSPCAGPTATKSTHIM